MNRTDRKENSLPESIPVPDYANAAISVLEEAGFETWLVGGCVRDALLSRPVHDVDIACSAPWTETQRAFEAAGYATHETGVKHGTLTVVVDNNAIEITTYRTEGAYSDGRHPDSVAPAETIEEDLARRDFTINAIAYHPNRGFRDPFNGLDDLRTGTIRTVGVPRDRFKEDSLRILRGCRFVAELGFSIEPDTLSAMQHGKTRMLSLPVERVRAELNRLLLGEHARKALLETPSVISAVLPEITAMVGFEQKSHYHMYDVLEHTAWVVQRTEPAVLNRWAAFLHDIGKPAAFFEREGVGHFHGHAHVSVIIGQGLLKRLGFSQKMQHDILTLVELHDEIIAPTPKAVKRTLHEFDGDVDLFRALCDLKKADALGHAKCCTSRFQLAEELLDVLDDVLDGREAFSTPDLAVSGDDVMQAFDMEPGPKVGALLSRALDAVIDGDVGNEREVLIAYLESIR